MEIVGEYRIEAPRQRVWDALNDPDILRDCIPGCKSLEKNADDTMTAVVVSKIGPVKATFNGTVKLENLDPPNGYSIVGEGKGGVAGFARGGADVRLTEQGTATVLTYDAKAQVGGKLAQLGSRLIDSTAKKMADDFFRAFSQRVGADEAVGVTAAVGEPSEAAPAAAPAAPASVPPAAAPATPAAAVADTPEAAAAGAQQPKTGLPAATEHPTRTGGISFSGPMLWIVIGVAALILIWAIAS